MIGVKDEVTSPTFSLVNEYVYLIESGEKKFYHLDLYRLKNVEEALDIGIENYLYDDNYSFKTWIVSIAKNHLRDTIRKKKILFENLDQIDSNIYKSHDDPEKNLIAKERLSELNNKIEELKPMYREILKLKYIEDYSLNEISKKLNQPINTIKIKIFRAKKILNKLIED